MFPDFILIIAVSADRMLFSAYLGFFHSQNDWVNVRVFFPFKARNLF